MTGPRSSIIITTYSSYPSGALGKTKLTVGRQIADFSIDTRAAYSTVNSPLTESLWQAVTVTVISVSPESQFFLKLLECAVGGTVLTHRFLCILECPITLLGRDLLSKLHALSRKITALPRDPSIACLAVAC